MKTQTYVYETDVLVGEAGGTLSPANRIPQFTFLPRRTSRCSSTSGTTSGGTQAIFLVSEDVTSVGGQGTCFPTRRTTASSSGSIAGKGADVIYGPDGKTYHLLRSSSKPRAAHRPLHKVKL